MRFRRWGAWALVLAACGGPPAPTTPAAIPSGPLPWAEAPVERYQVPVDDAPGLGADTPLVTMVVFSDFQCGYCRSALPVLERLLNAYSDTLRLHFRHLPLPMHEHAELAAMAAVEAQAQGGDEAFWRMHDRLFANPDALTLDDLVRHAGSLGLDAERMRVALRGRVHGGALERDVAVADRIGADGTPTFYVNGRPVLGALPFEEFRLLIDREIQLAEQALERGVPRARMYEAAMRDALAEAPRPPPRPREDGEGRVELDPTVTYAVPIDGAPALGPASAAVTVVIFSDFECPFCSRVLPALRELVQRYGDRLRLVFRHRPLPFHPRAEVAAAAAMEAHAQRGDEGFWAMHDALFANQDALRFDDLLGYASQVGLDLDRFRDALEEGAHEAAIERDNQLAQRFGARGTPTFFVNGRVVQGARSADDMAAVIDAALQRAQPAIDAGADDVYASVIADGAEEAVWREVRDEPIRIALPVPDDAPRRGPADAAVTIQLFTDFQCHFCAAVEPTLRRLLREHEDVAIVYRSLPLPFHDHAMPAAEAALEVRAQLGDEGFWRMYDRLFEHQDELDEDDLVAHAEAVGADGAAVRAALRDERHVDRVRQDLRAIVETGRRIGTPALLVGDVLVMGAQPLPVFEAALTLARD